MGLNFPAAPLVGEVYPLPAIPGAPQYSWDGEVWNVKPQAVIVDSYSKAESDANFVNIVGDTMSGNLAMPSANVTGAITAGSVWTPNLVMGSTSLTETFNEWGSMTVAGAVYFDFHSSATGSDYDVRLTYSGGNATAGQGALNMEAAGFTLTGAFTANGIIRSNSYTQAPTHYFADTGIYLTWDGGNVATNGNFYSHQSITSGAHYWCNGGVIYFLANGGLYMQHDGSNFWLRGSHFYTSNLIHSMEGFDSQGSYDFNYAMDTAPVARSIGQGAIVCIVHNFSGVIITTCHSSGVTEVYVCGSGQVTRIGTSGGSGTNVLTAAPENGYVVYSAYAGTAVFGVMTFRTRPAR